MQQAVWIATATGASVDLLHTIPSFQRLAPSATGPDVGFQLDFLVNEGDIPRSLFYNRSRQEIIDSVERRLYDGLESSGVDRDDVALHLSNATPWQSNPTTLCHLSSQHHGPFIRLTRAMRDDHSSFWRRATEGMIAIDFSKRFAAQHRESFTVSK